jgi:hypothetical protein
MEIPEIYIIIVSIISGIFSIASTTIGIEAYNRNSAWKNSHMGHFNFLVINLVVSIVVLLLAFVALFLHFRN